MKLKNVTILEFHGSCDGITVKLLLHSSSSDPFATGIASVWSLLWAKMS